MVSNSHNVLSCAQEDCSSLKELARRAAECKALKGASVQVLSAPPVSDSVKHGAPSKRTFTARL